MNKLILLFMVTFALTGCINKNNHKSANEDSLENTAKSQISKYTPSDSLGKYSYIMILFYKGKPYTNGTGFFIKKRNRLFLVSCYHGFAGQNTSLKIPNSPQADSLQFIYETQSLNTAKYNIDLREIKAHSKSYYFFEYPDIYVYELTGKLRPDALINSIENFITEIPKKEIMPIDIFAMGFGDTDKRNETEIKFKLKNTVYDDEKILYGPNKIKVIVKNSYFLEPKCVGGMSGSPVFYEYSNSNNFIFGGVISSHFEDTNTTLVVKPAEVTKKIDLMLLQH